MKLAPSLMSRSGFLSWASGFSTRPLTERLSTNPIVRPVRIMPRTNTLDAPTQAANAPASAGPSMRLMLRTSSSLPL